MRARRLAETRLSEGSVRQRPATWKLAASRPAAASSCTAVLVIAAPLPDSQPDANSGREPECRKHAKAVASRNGLHAPQWSAGSSASAPNRLVKHPPAGTAGRRTAPRATGSAAPRPIYASAVLPTAPAAKRAATGRNVRDSSQRDHRLLAVAPRSTRAHRESRAARRRGTRAN